MKSSSTSLVGSLTCLDEVQVMLSLRPRELTHIAQQLLQAGLGSQTGGQAARSKLLLQSLCALRSSTEADTAPGPAVGPGRG